MEPTGVGCACCSGVSSVRSCSPSCPPALSRVSVVFARAWTTENGLVHNVGRNTFLGDTPDPDPPLSPHRRAERGPRRSLP
ncbi:hypothetical protein T261_2809 [Streptomyces lydicus]|nr:hypothetical protein T261_2809 [Streptomyces lydicus]